MSLNETLPRSDVASEGPGAGSFPRAVVGGSPALSQGLQLLSGPCFPASETCSKPLVRTGLTFFCSSFRASSVHHPAHRAAELSCVPCPAICRGTLAPLVPLSSLSQILPVLHLLPPFAYFHYPVVRLMEWGILSFRPSPHTPGVSLLFHS